jgi:hypothetical protein
MMKVLHQRKKKAVHRSKAATSSVLGFKNRHLKTSIKKQTITFSISNLERRQRSMQGNFSIMC